MEHKIIEKEEFTCIGLPVKVSLNDSGYKQKISDNWTAFIPRAEDIKDREGSAYYGLCATCNGIEGEDCSFENIAAVEVSSTENIPEGMKSQVVPAAKYFVITHKGKLDTLGDSWNAVTEEMKRLEMKEDYKKIFFEVYDDRFKMDSDDSEVDLYTPIAEDI